MALSSIRRFARAALKGLIDMRDVELPKIALMLGELSGTLLDQINAVHNQYSTVPAPQTLTGRNTGAISTDPHGFTGLVTFAVLNTSDQISSQVTVDFSNPALVTLNDVIVAVNAGLTGATMTLSNGVLSLSAASANDGVAIRQDATTPSSRGGRGFAHFFGLNDLLEARALPSFESGLASGDVHGFGATGTTAIELLGPGGQVATSQIIDFSTPFATLGAVISDLNTKFSGFVTFALDANGRITTTPAAGFPDYHLHVATDSTDRGGSGITFSKFFGIGERYRMDAAFQVNVVSRIRNDHTQLALAQLELAPAAGQPALTSGDARGALALQAIETTALSFDPAGDLPAFTGQIAAYTATLLSEVGREASLISGLERGQDAAEGRDRGAPRRLRRSQSGRGALQHDRLPAGLQRGGAADHHGERDVRRAALDQRGLRKDKR